MIRHTIHRTLRYILLRLLGFEEHFRFRQGYCGQARHSLDTSNFVGHSGRAGEKAKYQELKITAIFFLALFPLPTYCITIMLNPAGDAHSTGRHIHDTFERSYTLRIAQQIKKSVEQQLPSVCVLLTRLPGEVTATLQYANFANRIQADLYLSIHCFEEQATKPRLYLYQFSYGETFALPKNSLSFYTYDQAHLLNLKTTTAYAHTLYTALNSYQKLFDIQGPYQIPFAPLIGITCPAFGIEIGLKNNDSWSDVIEPLVNAIITMMYGKFT